METPNSVSTKTSNDITTNLLFFGNEFPSDDLKEEFRLFRRTSMDKRFFKLAFFLEECTAVLREEFLKLPQGLQTLLPPFQTAINLVDSSQLHGGPLSGGLESALLCIVEIGMFIGHHESQSWDYSFPESNAILAELSIGLFAAGVISVSKNLLDVCQAGVKSVRVAFRLGIHVDCVSKSLEGCTFRGKQESWAYVLMEVCKEDVQKEIDQFNAAVHNPELTNVFISAADKTSLSVSGPPTRLKDAFQQSHALRYAKYLPIPVYNGLCHAPHIYRKTDVDSIVNYSGTKINYSRRVQIPLLSTRTGKGFSTGTLGELFEQICEEILTGTIYLDTTATGIIERISNSRKDD